MIKKNKNLINKTSNNKMKLNNKSQRSKKKINDYFDYIITTNYYFEVINF